MGTIRVSKKIESESVHIPELRPWIGQIVDITVTNDASANAPSEWLPGFWETLKTGWQGEPLVRPEQGTCDMREQI